MHISEAEISPYHASTVPAARNVLVFAPHPDDEIFGCGGAIIHHVRAGHSVHVILLTSGEFGSLDDVGNDYALTRQNESAYAALLLGLPPPRCWGLADRELTYDEDLVQRMVEVVEQVGADVIYAPSPWELHPDHRATAMAAVECVRRSPGSIKLYLYEVSAPLRPNVLVDVTSVWELKQQAMRAFASQEKKLPYSSFIAALNRFRALTLAPTVEYAEAFEMYASDDLRAGGPMLIEGERERLLKRGIAVVPQDAPLVSVIVRTMGRSTLSKALSSIAFQTYAHLEIVLVDATGQGLSDAQFASARVPSRLISTGSKLGRAHAANAGLNAARGEYLIFLDDDDWFYPDHIAKLVFAIRQSSDVRAVHTEVECVNEAGAPLGEIFDFPYATGELRYGNFMPIHSVLFHRSIRDDGCRFDPEFDLYEDWDFWLQVETMTSFGFVDGVSAAYRIHPGAGEGVQAERSRAHEATAYLYSKWDVLQSAQTFNELVSRALSRRSALRQLKYQFKESQRLARELVVQQQQAMVAQKEADAARQDAHQMRTALDEACVARDELMAAHDQACAARDEVARERDEFAAQLSSVRSDWIDEHARRVVADASVKHLGEEVQRLSAELLLTRDHVTNVQQSMHVTQVALEESRRQVGELLSSTSWRISKPVRMTGRVMRNIRQVFSVIKAARQRGLGLGHLARRTGEVLGQEGWSGVRERARRMLNVQGVAENGEMAAASGLVDNCANSSSYANWVAIYDNSGEKQRSNWRERLRMLRVSPLVSLIMPVYNPDADDLQRAIASVQAQIYPNWELCICDDASPSPGTRLFLESAARSDPRIRLTFHDKNRHISHATNTAINLAHGDYFAFLDHDDELRPHALLCAVEMFASNPDLKVLYSDEDKINQSGTRLDPYFKPDFNLGLLRSHNYMCHFAVYERRLMEQLGGLRPGFEGAQDYDLALRAVDAVSRQAIGHIPQVLYHWRTASGSTASGHANKSYAFEAGRRALAEHLQRRGVIGEVVEAKEARGMYRILWQRPDPAPLVSIIIPTRNGQDILRQCLDSLEQTSYPNYEVIVIDNGSDDPIALGLLAERERCGQIRVLRDDSPFNFSALNNRAVNEAARGEFVLLMNNDIEITHPEWLDEMVGPAMEQGVGCVGARLWYPDGRLQHAGVILVCGVAGHAHKFLQRGQHGYMGRAVLAQDFVAVTAACLLVRKSIYDEVDGLDPALAVAFNDVDFCLRVHQAGYRNHWTPYAELIHHESISRGYEDTPEKQRRFKGEIDILQSRWSALLERDPCYNPNLTADAEDFSLAFPPRVRLTTASAQ